ncbi:MAG: hypothetical protein LUQ31_11275 [Methanoregula sp.]|nr:hypothetical protein [Methanoregula sp.]
MRGSDGIRYNQKHPGITLVCFGRIEHDLKDELLHSLSAFFDTLQEELPVRPVCSCRFEPDPEKIPAQNQETAYFPVLEIAGGNIILGVTNTGFYDPSLPRYIFSYGRFNGLGLLSTYRFRNETNTRRQYLERMGKQIIKTLAMACSLDACPDKGCVVSYHRYVDDLDHNRYVCESCRTEFIRSLKFFLDIPYGDASNLLQTEGE